MCRRNDQVENMGGRAWVLYVHGEGPAAGGGPDRSRDRGTAPAAADQKVGQGCGSLSFSP